MRKPIVLSRRAFVGGMASNAAALCLCGCQSSMRTTSQPGAGPASATPAPAPTEWEGLAEIALKRLRRGGADYGDIRILTTTRQSIIGRDRRIERVDDDRDSGFGVRALVGGGWGFAASPIMTPVEIARVADLALEIARASNTFSSTPLKLAPEPPHRDHVTTAFEVDPFSVSIDEKTRILLDTMEALQSVDKIRRCSATIWMQRDEKLFASTEGALIRFDLLATHAGTNATAVTDGRFAARSYETPYQRVGFEQIRAANLPTEASRVAREAVEKASATPIDAGDYDLILDPRHLSLTIHESCGHPSELDRALGYEANYAGTSHLTPEKLGKHRHGSNAVNLVADNTEPGTLCATGYDDDGVAAQRWDIVREGLFVGFSDSRETAPMIGENRSHGSNRADGWSSIPIVRISNIGLEPGTGRLDDMISDVKRGIYIDGHGSFSIDQKRYNFQFGGDAFWLIENGRKTRMLRDVIYYGITPEFWAKCDAVADRSHRGRFGFITCAKGQPVQSAWMTHAASHARFRGVSVRRGETVG